MNIQLSTLFCICIAFAIPLLVLSTSRQQLTEDLVNQIDRSENFNLQYQRPLRSLLYNNHYLLKKAADFEQILKPCNQMPASGRDYEYAACVRNRMLLMGRRKRRANN